MNLLLNGSNCKYLSNYDSRNKIRFILKQSINPTLANLFYMCDSLNFMVPISIEIDSELSHNLLIEVREICASDFRQNYLFVIEQPILTLNSFTITVLKHVFWEWHNLCSSSSVKPVKKENNQKNKSAEILSHRLKWYLYNVHYKRKKSYSRSIAVLTNLLKGSFNHWSVPDKILNSKKYDAYSTTIGIMM